jgi:hypothetical protein
MNFSLPMAVKLLVMMTLPANPKSSNLEDQLRTLQIHKENFVLPNPHVALMMALLVESLNKNEDDRTRQDIELIELVMALFKNLLAVPDPPVTNNAQNATRFQLQDDFIETLKKESVLKLYLVLAQNVEADKNRTMNVLLLETFYLLFRREDTQELVDTWYSFQRKRRLWVINWRRCERMLPFPALCHLLRAPFVTHVLEDRLLHKWKMPPRRFISCQSRNWPFEKRESILRLLLCVGDGPSLKRNLSLG